MSISTALGVAIGLGSLYLMLSLLGTALFELWSRIARLRARNLQVAIIRIIPDDDLRCQFYNHPLIKSLAKQPPVGYVVQPPKIPSSVFTTVIFDLLSRVEAAGAEKVTKTNFIVQMRLRADMGLQGEIRETLVALLSASATQDSIDKANASVAKWFDDVMERARDWYKRKSQTFLLIMGLAIAAGFNIDTVALAKAFYDDPELPVSQAQTILPGLKNAVDTAREAGAVNADPAQNEKRVVMTHDLATKLDAFVASLVEHSVPFGWNAATTPTEPWPIAQKILGILITAVAISMGAPFWFDFLNRFANPGVASPAPAPAANPAAATP